jgi:hypothetical protein
MVILIFEWEKASSFQLLFSCILFPLSEETNGNKFWVCVSRDISSHFIILYILKLEKVTIYVIRTGSGTVEFILENRTCPFQPISTTKNIRLTIRRSTATRLLNHFSVRIIQFADFYPLLPTIRTSAIQIQHIKVWEIYTHSIKGCRFPTESSAWMMDTMRQIIIRKITWHLCTHLW